MDIKSAFLYGRIEEEVYMCQPLGFEDPDYPDKVYKVEKPLYGLHQASRAWYETLSKYLLDIGFHRGLQVKHKSDGIFISQDKYVDEILRVFKYEHVKPTSTSMDKEKALLKYSDGDDVDVHLYRSMIGSLMYLTSSKPEIMFVVCTCAKLQVTHKVSHLHAVKKIFKYLKGHLKLGLCYHKDSSFDLVAYTDSDYAGASLDRKSTSGGCQFLGYGLISWQCKKKTVVATYTTEAEYVVAASCYGQFWCTTSARTLNNREIELNITVDGQVKTITKAFVRRHIKLEDADDTRLKTSHKRLYIAPSLTQKVFSNMKRESKGYSGVETTLFLTMLVTKQVSQGEGPTSPVGTQNTPTIIESSPHLQNISITYRKTRTKIKIICIRIPQSNVPSRATNESITKKMHDGLGRATTTASSLELEQGSGNISKTQTKATPSGPSSLRTSSKGGPGCHFTIRDSPVQARSERLSNLPNEPPLKEGNTSRSEEGNIQLLELMAICTKLSDKVTHLENELTSTKAVYNKALIALTKRVKKLEKKLKHKCRRTVIYSSKEEEASLDHEDSPKQGKMIKEIDKDENVNLVKSSEQGEAHETAEHIVDLSTDSQIDDDETLAKTLLNIKRSAAKDKGKTIMQEPESPKKIKKKEIMQIIQREQWDDVQAQIQADEDLAQRMIKEEKESLSIKEREGSSKEGKRLKRSAEKELGQEQKVEEEIAQQEDVVTKQAGKESFKKARGRLKRKTSKAREDKDKRQKKQDDPEKLTLLEADGSYKTYIFFREMLNDFDREDQILLYKLFNKKCASTRPGFDDLIPWGDMKIMYEPDGDDTV
nr:hypothetical protein [Tanacetum cinerariifolium]